MSAQTRDRHAAAALGRPFRINDEDCDVEGLCEADFELDIVSESPIMATQNSYHVQYQIAITKLAGSCKYDDLRVSSGTNDLTSRKNHVDQISATQL